MLRILGVLVCLCTASHAFYTLTASAAVSMQCNIRLANLGSINDAGSVVVSEPTFVEGAPWNDIPNVTAAVTEDEFSLYMIDHPLQFRSICVDVFGRCALMSTLWLTALTSNLMTADASSALADLQLQTPPSFAQQVEDSRPLNSDEFRITFPGQSLDLRLSETYYKGFPIVTVKQIMSSQLRALSSELREGAIVTQINNAKVDGKPLSEMVDLVKQSPRPLVIRFRDPSRFFQQLDSTAGPPRRIVSTSYLPANARFVAC